MKNCIKCSSSIPISMFIDGRDRNLQRRKYCISCSPFATHNTSKLELLGDRKRGERKKGDSYKYQKKRALERKKTLVEMLGGKCQVCGYNKNLGVLVFHHIDPRKKTIKLDSRGLATTSWQTILVEVQNCQLLCANCHIEGHYPYLNLWGRTDSNREPSDYA